MRKILLFLLSLMLAATLFTGCSSKKNVVMVGAKAFTEHDILGNVLKFLIEEHTDLSATVKFNLDSLVVFEAIKNGEIDLYIDYTGTVYGNYFGYTEKRTPIDIYNLCKKELKERFDLLMLDQMGFNNTYTLSVRKDTVDKYNLKSISDLAKVSHELSIAANIESLNREDGVKGVVKAYNMNFIRAVAVEGNLRYTAIENDEVQVIDAYATEGLTLKYHLTVLDDDLSFFPAYHAAVIIRQASADKYPELLKVMDMLTGTIDDDRMRDLNYRVDVLQKDPQAVARAFLKEAGLAKK